MLNNKNAENVKKNIKSVILDMANSFITHNELKRGKSPFWQDYILLFASKAKMNIC